MKFIYNGAAPFNGLAVNAATAGANILVAVIKFAIDSVFDPAGQTPSS